MLDRQSAAMGSDADRIMRDPTFQTLVRERTGFGWTMSAVMLAVYLGFVLLAALDNGFMASTVGGTSLSWGILLGLGVIVFAFALTGVYVGRANTRYDELTARIEGDLT